MYPDSRGLKRGLQACQRGSSGARGPSEDSSHSRCRFPDGQASTYQKGLSIRRGVGRRKQEADNCCVFPQGLRRVERNCLQQLQSLSLVCKYPAALFSLLTPSSVSLAHTHTSNPSLHILSLPLPPPKGVQFILLHGVLNISEYMHKQIRL